jgi:hypothetical protein
MVGTGGARDAAREDLMSASKTLLGSVLMAAAATSVLAVEPHPDARPNPAALALASHAFPGVPIETPNWWVEPNGPPEVLRLGEFHRLRRGDRWWLTLSMDSIGRPDRGSEDPLADSTRGMFVVARTDDQGVVVTHKVVHVDPSAQHSSTTRVDFVETRRAGWPLLRVAASSTGQNRLHALRVWWAGEFDSGLDAWAWRWPTSYWHVRPDGVEEREALHAEVVDGRLELIGLESGRRFSFPCPGGACAIRPLALIEQLRD